MLKFFKKEMIKKVIKDTCLISPYINKSINCFDNLEDISKQDIFQNINKLDINIFIEKENKIYLLVYNNIVVYYGFYAKTDKDRKLGLNVIVKDYEEQKHYIKALMLYIFDDNLYKQYINHHCDEIFNNILQTTINFHQI